MSIRHLGADPSHPYAPAVRAGDWLFVSGQASTDPDTREILPGTFEEEFHRTVRNLHRVLSLAGATIEQVVKITAIVSDGRNVQLYNRLYLAAFEHPRPARTTLISPLERVQVELECQAYLGS